MRLCFGSFAKVLSLYRIDRRKTSNAKLIDILFELPLKNGEYNTKATDASATRLLKCVDSVPPISSEDAQKCIASGSIQTYFENFDARVIKAHVIKSDRDSLISVVSVLRQIIKDDSSFPDNPINEMSGTTKKALLSQGEFTLAEISKLLAGICLYVVVAVKNKNEEGCDFNPNKEINLDYVQNVSERITIIEHDEVVLTTAKFDLLHYSDIKLAKHIISAISSDIVKIVKYDKNLTPDYNPYVDIVEPLIAFLNWLYDGKNAAIDAQLDEYRLFLGNEIREFVEFSNKLYGKSLNTEEYEDVYGKLSASMQAVRETYELLVRYCKERMPTEEIDVILQPVNSSGRETDNVWTDIYLKKAIAEYGKMRTSLFDKTSKDFYTFYVSCDLKIGERIITEVNAVKLRELSCHIIISASGGFGKSTMMRHLLLSAIEKYGELGLLPVFIRLADYIYSDATDFFDFVLEQANCFGAKVSKEQLLAFLKNGACFLLLDGLDEVLPQEIKRLDYKMRSFFSAYSDNLFVITTRPYPVHKLNSLGSFEVVSLQPLRYEQAVELVRKREKFYNDTIKGSKFSKDMTRQLFDKHEGLMRNPKLLTIILQTYGRLNLIPDKLHILYREIIKILSELYDAESGNTNRMLKTRLSVRDLLSKFSELCYRAYENGELDFTEHSIDRYLRQLDGNLDVGDFLFDVCENLCFLEASGGRFRFFHRSMQEYFCASYLSQLPPERWSGFRAVLRTRPQDYNESVLSYLYETNPESVEEHIFLPFLSDLFGTSKKHTGYHNYLLSQYPVIYYDYEEPLEESNNQPLAPILQYLVVMLDPKYDSSTSDFPFYRELAEWVTLMPLLVFADDDDEDGYDMVNVAIAFSAEGEDIAFADKSPEVFPPERMHCSTYDEYDGDTIYDEMGWELEFKTEEIYAAYENEGKYDLLVKMLDSDGFEFKAEYFALFDYYEKLKQQYEPH